MNKAIDSAMSDAISGGVFPAADLLVARGGETIYSSHYGDAREHTCFDIASVTKVVSTASLTIILVAEGLLRLGDTVYQWLAGAREAWHKEITIAHLMNHTSGLPAWQPYYRELPQSLVGTDAGKKLLLASCLGEPLLSEPGRETVYGDPGYMILGEIVEEAGSAPLDALFMQHVARPLHLADTFFVRNVGARAAATSSRTAASADQHVPTPEHGIPSERPARKAGEHRRFAPTEDCPWRRRVIHGEVHDQNAYALGGVAGHAGLFSTAADLNRFVVEFTRSWRGESDWLPADIIREHIAEMPARPAGDTFALGWMRPSRRSSSAGHHFSPNSIGHLGFTGCSIWIDLKEDFWIILLTNRVHPSAMNEKIKSFRPHIHNLICDELIG